MKGAVGEERLSHMLAVIMFVFSVISIEVWNTQMPVWALVLALIVGEL